MKITKEEDYAVNLIHALSSSRGKIYLSLTEVADRYRLSKFFLKKVAKKLIDAGLLTSKEGNKGGYLLAKPAFQISYGEIITAISGPIDVSPCSVACLKKNCQQRPVWNKINKKISEILFQQKLSKI